MEWLVLFAASWILFILLIDLRKLKVNIWCGLLAAGTQLFVDTMAMNHKLYIINNPVLQISGSSVFFGFGPVLVIGTLLAQYHPHKKSMRIINVLVLSGMYSLQELLLLRRGALVYTNWHFTESVFLNTVILATLSWFTIVVLSNRNRRRES